MMQPDGLRPSVWVALVEEAPVVLLPLYADGPIMGYGRLSLSA